MSPKPVRLGVLGKATSRSGAGIAYRRERRWVQAYAKCFKGIRPVSPDLIYTEVHSVHQPDYRENHSKQNTLKIGMKAGLDSA